MATEGLRRSTRIRKPVKSYAAEQAEEDEAPLKAAPTKRKRKAATDGDDDEDSVDTAKPAKKAPKKAKSTKQNETDDAEERPKKAAKASSSKAKRTATNRSWHADAAERRIAVNNRNVTKLRPGQQEARLRE